MSAEDRNFWVSLGWHVVVAGFVVYLTVAGQLAVVDGLLAVTTIAGLALPSTIQPKGQPVVTPVVPVSLPSA